MTADRKSKPTAAERLDEIGDRFLYRQRYDGLAWEQERRLTEETEATALFGLLGALQSKVGPYNQRLTREGLVDTIAGVLERAAERERERAAELGGIPRPVRVHARAADGATALCGGGGPKAALDEDAEVTCPACAVQVVGRAAVNASAAADLPWQVHAQPEGGERWLVNAFATRQLAERFVERHPDQYGPLTIEHAADPAAETDGGA